MLTHLQFGSPVQFEICSDQKLRISNLNAANRFASQTTQDLVFNPADIPSVILEQRFTGVTFFEDPIMEISKGILNIEVPSEQLPDHLITLQRLLEEEHVRC